MSISIKNLEKSFDDYQALKNINLDVESGKFYALLGPSGCGKTTLLRIIAGLETADSGQIFFDDRDMTNVDVRNRGIGFVFQNYALFRHMTVFDNVAFGLRVKPRKERLSDEKITKRVRELLSMIQLDWLENAYPSRLSGGQKQRVALARALAVTPKVLLLDEPFGALDAKVRKDLRLSLRDIQHELNITCILVTHDQEEALSMADKIVVMNKGKIEQTGTGPELYNNPSTGFTVEFLGEVNIFNRARVENNQLMIGGYTESAPENFLGREENVIAYARPQDITISHTADDNSIAQAEIQDIQEIGPVVRIFLDSFVSDKKIEVVLTKQVFDESPFLIQEKVYFKPEKTFVFALDNLVDYMI
ncbi:sulfate ABC transporter ATP-binding protein [Neisseriaceae bacterium PsAf]|nr:sulfate ABC transporter ATP-binding protein [Neisseriaceae bacterium PsAf]MCV2502980.1 sulfate ABC transporter ATP-binding protein [Neisseriaceae bacterium]